MCPRRRIHGRRRTGALTEAQALDLIIGGPTGETCLRCAVGRTCERRCWVFPTAADRRAAWFQHREMLMASVHPDVRPAAWEQYERDTLLQPAS